MILGVQAKKTEETFFQVKRKGSLPALLSRRDCPSSRAFFTTLRGEGVKWDLHKTKEKRSIINLSILIIW